jgi:hypothetical protein
VSTSDKRLRSGGGEGVTYLRITYCSWGPIVHQSVSVGIPPGWGARLAVRRYPDALRKLGRG